MGTSRTLVLSIDRDDDIGFKASIDSPVVGRKACLDAAVKLALADPEDSDVNAIFQAISTYDRLRSEGEDPEVAVRMEAFLLSGRTHAQNQPPQKNPRPTGPNHRAPRSRDGTPGISRRW